MHQHQWGPFFVFTSGSMGRLLASDKLLKALSQPLVFMQEVPYGAAAVFSKGLRLDCISFISCPHPLVRVRLYVL
nr:hypothetical protein Iba_chr11aCG5000 [Ipomoea batatas]GMD53713.1 hypothetical protein Iba_chr11cCG5280 [Ipomoea batatas]